MTRPWRAGVAAVLRAGLLAVAVMVAVALVPGLLPAQTMFNPRDDQFRLLGLVRAQSDFERAEAEYQRGRELFEGRVIPASQLEELRAALDRARVNYLQQALTVIFAAPHVSIDRAVKRRDPGGRIHVQMTLRNTTAGGGAGVEAARVSELIDAELLDLLQPDEVQNVYVSLKADPGLGGAILSSPYERHIPVLRAGEPVTLDFRLLRDTDDVVVAVNYADRVHERRIVLEADASADIVMVESLQFSQEADLGGQAVYDLRLERFTADQTVFRLAALGLPVDVRHEFRDPETGARLNQIRFADGQSQRSLQLVLSLPQREGAGFQVDEPMEFWTLVVDEGAAAELEALATGDDLEGGMSSVRGGRAELELVPRGVGRIEVRAVNLYHEIRRGQEVELDVTVRNTGTRRLDNVRMRVDAPLDWEVQVAPEFLPELAVSGETRVRVVLSPPPDVVVGDFEARLRTESAAADRRVETEDRTIRVHVASATGWVGTAGLLLVLAGLVGAVVTFGLRVSRR